MTISAGDAQWKITGDTSELDAALQEGAANVEQTTNQAMESVASIGKGMTVAGAAITGALGLAVNGFADYAETVDTASKKTGFSTDAIQQWKYAAEQSSASLEDVSNSVRFMANNLDAASTAGEGTVTAFDKLGLNVQELQAMQPEQAFEKILLAVAAVPDAMQQTAIAQDIFGRGASALKPLMAEGAEGIAALKQEAQDLGLVLSGEAIVSGEAFGDEMSKLTAELKVLGMDIGQALLPALKDLVTSIGPVVQGMSEWIQTHPTLTQGIVTVAGAVGAFMVTLGPLLMMLPGLVTSFELISVVAGVVAGVLSGPVVAAIAAVVLAGALLYESWDGIKAGAQSFWQGLESAFQTGAEAVGAVWEWMVSAGTWVWETLTGGFQALSDAVTGIFTGLADFFVGTWNGIVSIFQGAWDIIRGIVNAVIGGVNSVMGAASMLPGVPQLQLPMLAEGGPAQAGQPYIVGERGRELFVPSETGRVENAANTGAGGVSLNINITGPINASSAQDVRKLSEEIAAVTLRELRAAGMTA